MSGRAGPADVELVDGVRHGDVEAAEALARRHLPGCRAVALAIVGDPSLADDLAQDAFVAAIEGIDGCRRPERFASWLGQIVRNRARDELKSKRRRDAVPLDAVSLRSRASPEKDAELAELRDRLLGALAELPEERRVVLILHDMEDWTHREIAEHLGLPEGTVRSHVHHARRALRGLLHEHGGDA